MYLNDDETKYSIGDLELVAMNGVGGTLFVDQSKDSERKTETKNGTSGK